MCMQEQSYIRGLCASAFADLHVCEHAHIAHRMISGYCKHDICKGMYAWAASCFYVKITTNPYDQNLMDREREREVPWMEERGGRRRGWRKGAGGVVDGGEGWEEEKFGSNMLRILPFKSFLALLRIAHPVIRVICSKISDI